MGRIIGGCKIRALCPYSSRGRLRPDHLLKGWSRGTSSSSLVVVIVEGVGEGRPSVTSLSLLY